MKYLNRIYICSPSAPDRPSCSSIADLRQRECSCSTPSLSLFLSRFKLSLRIQGYTGPMANESRKNGSIIRAGMGLDFSNPTFSHNRYPRARSAPKVDLGGIQSAGTESFPIFFNRAAEVPAGVEARKMTGVSRRALSTVCVCVCVCVCVTAVARRVAFPGDTAACF